MPEEGKGCTRLGPKLSPEVMWLGPYIEATGGLQTHYDHLAGLQCLLFSLHQCLCTCDVPGPEPAGQTNAAAHLWSSLVRGIPVPRSRELLCTFHSNHSLMLWSIIPNACLSYTLHELQVWDLLSFIFKCLKHREGYMLAQQRSTEWLKQPRNNYRVQVILFPPSGLSVSSSARQRTQIGPGWAGE